MERAVRRKRNKTRNLLLLILLAVLCIVAYVLVHHFAGQKESSADGSETEAAAEELLQVETDDAVKLSYEYGSEKVVLVKEDDTWKLSEDKDYPVDQNLIASMLLVFSNTSATKTIAENKDNAAEYGMDAPLLTATLILKDKTKTTFTVGMAGIGDSSEEYYVTVSKKEGIYMTSSTVYTAFQYEAKQLGKIEEIPSISSDAIYNITVGKGSNTVFEAKKDLDNESVNYDNWTIGAPYDSHVAADTSSISSLASIYTSYSFLQNADYDAGHDAAYGLDNPSYTVEIKYAEEVSEESEETEATASPDTSKSTETVKKSFTLFIGNQDNDGNYYVKTSDTKYIYLMSADDVASYVTIDAFSNVSTVVFGEDASDVTKIVAKTPSKTVTYTADTEEEELRGLCESITTLSYKGEIDSDAKAGDIVLTLKISYGKEKNETKTFVFTKQDSNYDQVTADDKTNFVVDGRDVETILSKIQS